MHLTPVAPKGEGVVPKGDDDGVAPKGDGVAVAAPKPVAGEEAGAWKLPKVGAAAVAPAAAAADASLTPAW